VSDNCNQRGEAMPSVPRISESEWDVMKIVWDHGPLSAGDVVRHLRDASGWHPRTIKTLLGRLVRKGAVAMVKDGQRYLYRSRIGREAALRQESRSFLQRVFDGAVAPALVHFLKESKLSQDQIEQLRQILDQEAP
jgi:BlaI family transcriptional regulator, penicillinase repressor